MREQCIAASVLVGQPVSGISPLHYRYTLTVPPYGFGFAAITLALGLRANAVSLAS